MSEIDCVFKIDREQLQSLQDAYSAVTNLFMFAVNETGERVTKMSGNEEDMSRVAALLEEGQIRSILSRVLYSGVEEQVVEDTAYSNMKVASVGVKVNGKPAFAWLICGFMSEDDEEEDSVLSINSTIPRDNFQKAVDLIREISKKIYGDAFVAANAVADAQRAISSNHEMERALKKSEAMAQIVSQLESEEPFEAVADHVLDYIGGYADISHAYVLRPSKDGRGVDIIGRFINPSNPPLDPVIDNIGMNILSYMGGRATVISYKTRIDSVTRQYLDEIGVTALVCVPIVIKNEVSMYVMFMNNTPTKEWSMDEIKFFGDSVKILQSLVASRIQKHSVTSSFQALDTILNNVGNIIYVRDLYTGLISYANRLCQETFGEEIKSGEIADIFENPYGYYEDLSPVEIYFDKKNRWYEAIARPMNWVDGSQAMLHSIIDITEKKQYQDRIEQQANSDFLTGLYNRMCCEKDLEKYIELAKAEGGRGAVIYIDLDDFKHINDGLGHQYGDVLLKDISDVLRHVSGVENSCYRMGGDEFIVIIPSTSFERFEEIIEAIQVEFNKPWFLKDGDYYCTSSMGIVTFPDEGDTIDELIKKADIAMYEAKKSGKNKVARYSANSDLAAEKRLGMEKSMRSAAKDSFEQFEVYYQPIIDITKSGYPCVGAEALVRWNSKDLGFVSPAEFIPLAEYLGLINPIGDHVLRNACRELKYWNENGHPYYKVNVNLSVVQLMQADIAASIAAAIEETGINPKNLTLEVTESLAINDMKRMKRILKSIKKTGVKIALDDFGTGYSSLNHIREIPLDVIKVDRSFIRSLDKDQYAQAFIKMIGELAATLNVRVCVEGIENEEQFTVLKKMNVRMVQGYYFDKPMTKEQFEEKYL